MLQKYLANGVQVIVRRHIHNSEIFVVELAVGLGAVAVTFDQIGEELKMLRYMTVHIHRHKAG